MILHTKKAQTGLMTTTTDADIQRRFFQPPTQQNYSMLPLNKLNKARVLAKNHNAVIQSDNTGVYSDITNKKNLIKNIQSQKLQAYDAETMDDMDFRDKYGTSIHRYKYDTNPEYKAQSDIEGKISAKIHGNIDYPINNVNRSINPNNMFMAGVLTNNDLIKDKAQTNLEVIETALPTPLIDKVGKFKSVFSLVKGANKAKAISKLSTKGKSLIKGVDDLTIGLAKKTKAYKKDKAFIDATVAKLNKRIISRTTAMDKYAMKTKSKISDYRQSLKSLDDVLHDKGNPTFNYYLREQNINPDILMKDKQLLNKYTKKFGNKQATMSRGIAGTDDIPDFETIGTGGNVLEVPGGVYGSNSGGIGHIYAQDAGKVLIVNDGSYKRLEGLSDIEKLKAMYKQELGIKILDKKSPYKYSSYGGGFSERAYTPEATLDFLTLNKKQIINPTYPKGLHPHNVVLDTDLQTSKSLFMNPVKNKEAVNVAANLSSVQDAISQVRQNSNKIHEYTINANKLVNETLPALGRSHRNKIVKKIGIGAGVAGGVAGGNYFLND